MEGDSVIESNSQRLSGEIHRLDSSNCLVIAMLRSSVRHDPLTMPRSLPKNNPNETCLCSR